jgi:HK97 family phage major capsid protein
LTLEKLLDSIPVSHEAMTDIDFVAGEIRRFLEVNVSLKEEQQVINGNGTAPEWEGLYTNATDYTQAIGAADKVLTGGVVKASIADLIMYVATKITNGYNGKYNPNFVLVNPIDFLGLRTIKTTDGIYVIPPFMAADGSRIGGLQVVESSLVTANTLLVGDSNMATLYQQEAFSLELGWVSTQFTEDMLTLKARKRGNVLVRTVDATAIYKVTDIQTRVGDISA